MIAILLSTYNGSKYLSKQLDSLLQQTFEEWNLYIRDDCSTDDTIEIILHYCNLDKRIHFINESSQNLRAPKSFEKLMEFAMDKADYFMFCDQDDYWNNDKIEITFAEMQKQEKYSNENILIYGTQLLVDEDLVDLNLPIPKHYRENFGLKTLLVENPVYGCTMMINKNLLKRSLPFSNHVENHDYWIAFIASSLSARVSYIDKPLMLYRQHSSNLSGNYKDSHFKQRLKRLIGNKEMISFKKRNLMFSDALKQTSNALSSTNRYLIEAFIKKTSKGGISAVLFLISKKIKKQKIIQNIQLHLLMFKIRLWY